MNTPNNVPDLPIIQMDDEETWEDIGYNDAQLKLIFSIRNVRPTKNMLDAATMSDDFYTRYHVAIRYDFEPSEAQFARGLTDKESEVKDAWLTRLKNSETLIQYFQPVEWTHAHFASSTGMVERVPYPPITSLFFEHIEDQIKKNGWQLTGWIFDDFQKCKSLCQGLELKKKHHDVVTQQKKLEVL